MVADALAGAAGTDLYWLLSTENCTPDLSVESPPIGDFHAPHSVAVALSALEATQGQNVSFFSQLPCKCYLEEVALRQHLWGGDLKFAPGLPTGWSCREPCAELPAEKNNELVEVGVLMYQNRQLWPIVLFIECTAGVGRNVDVRGWE